MKRGYPFLVRIFVLAVLCGLTILPAKILAITPQSSWFSSSDPVFAKQVTNVSDSQLPSTFIQHGNVDCSNLSFTKRDGAIIPPLFYSESQLSGCFLDTTAGEVLDNGFIDVPGTPYVAETVHPDHTPFQFFAFPNSDVFVSRQSGAPAIGNYVWFSHLSGSIRYSSSVNGKIWAEVSPVNPIPIADLAGNKLPVLLDNMVGSDDGKWAVVDSPGRGILEINLETMEIIPFQTSLENGDGTGSAERIAISGDGRFVAVASKAFHYFRIFDMNTCAAVPNVITEPVACQSQNLDTYFRSKVSDLGGILQMRFITNNQLKIYASYDISSSYKTGQFALAAPGTTLVGMEYLGMGDSFSSGEGSQNYEVGTDDPNNKCHLSKLSYPYIIAKKLSFNSFHSVACSGAVTFNVIGGSGITKDKSVNSKDNQYSNLPKENSLGIWAPGYKAQVKFVSENQPQLITLNVIGNDLNFGPIAEACAKPGTCYPTYEDRLEVFNFVDSKLPTLTKLYKKLKTTAPNNSRIYAVGYPQIALSTGNCGLNVHMNQSELEFTEALISRINVLVKSAASNAGIYYADVEDAFVTHRLCEAGPSDIAMNGITAGNDILHVIGNESFHPNAYGQFLLAQKILGLTNNLGILPELTSMPLPAIDKTSPALKNVPKSGRTPKRIATNVPKESAVGKDKPTTTKIKGHTFALQPNTTYTVTNNGTPSTLVTSDANSDITITIPTNVVGTVVVKVEGQDVTNLPVSVSTMVDVIDSDNPSPCGVIPASGQDTDQDGIDDACDPAIGPAPIISTPSQTDAISGASITNAALLGPTNPASETGINQSLLATATLIPGSVDVSSSITVGPQQSGTPTKQDIRTSNPDLTLSNTISPPVSIKESGGKVLGEATTNLHAAATASHQALKDISAVHAVAFAAISIGTLSGLLILAFLHMRNNELGHFSATQRR